MTNCQLIDLKLFFLEFQLIFLNKKFVGLWSCMYLIDILYLTKKIITLRAKFSHHNLLTRTSLSQIHMLDSRWIADNKDIKQSLWLLGFSHTIDILFVFEMPLKQHNKSLHSIRWSPLVQVFLTSLLQKESWVTSSTGVSKARREYGHCTSLFLLLDSLGMSNRRSTKLLLVVGIIKKTWWYMIHIVIRAKWMYQGAGAKWQMKTLSWKKSFFFSYGTICQHMQIELVIECIKNDRWKHAHKSTIDVKNMRINPE
jgi:hypothetical protein